MERVLPGENFISSIRPLYYVSRVLGLAPFSFTNSFVVKKLSSVWILYTVILLIAVLICGILCIVQRLEQTGLLATVVVNEFLMIFIGALKAVLSIVISATINGVKSRKFVSTVVKVDRNLLSDSNISYRKTFIFTLVQVIAVYSYEAALFTYDTWVWTRAVGRLSAWYFISGYPHRIVNMGGVLQFCDLVLLLRSRLQALNSRLSFILKDSVEPYSDDILTKVLHESAPRSVAMRNERSVSEIRSVTIIPFRDTPQLLVNRLRQPRFKIPQQRNVHNVRELYDDLCDISVLINSMYGFQLLLELGVTTVELILSSYLMLATILGFQNVETNTIGQFVSLMTAWLLQYAFKLISITAPCQSATTEAENTAVLVQKLLLVQHFDQDTVTELRLFSQQLLQRKMKFTAFGFLSLDYSLLFTILGGVTTYLVVAMQYRN